MPCASRFQSAAPAIAPRTGSCACTGSCAGPRSAGSSACSPAGDRVLLVRHTYGDRRWDLPGGRMRRDEAALSTARREMHEELGVLIQDWAPIGVVSGTAEFRRDRMQIFHAEISDGEIEIDRGELATMHWFPRRELPDDVAKYVPQILADHEAVHQARQPARLLDAGSDRRRRRRARGLPDRLRLPGLDPSAPLPGLPVGQEPHLPRRAARRRARRALRHRRRTASGPSCSVARPATRSTSSPAAAGIRGPRERRSSRSSRTGSPAASSSTTTSAITTGSCSSRSRARRAVATRPSPSTAPSGSSPATSPEGVRVVGLMGNFSTRLAGRGRMPRATGPTRRPRAPAPGLIPTRWCPAACS